MSESRNIYTQPMNLRLRRAFGFLFDHIRNAPDHLSDHYRASAQRDVGRSARDAAGIQLVMEGMQDPRVEMTERLMKTELNRWDDMGTMDYDGPPEAA